MKRLFPAAGLLLGAALLVSGCAAQQPASTSNAAPPAPAEAKGVDELKVSEFILGAGDSIEISVYRQDDLKRSVKIESSGRFMFPLIGEVKASGKSVFALRDEIQERLAPYVVKPQVVVSITQVQSQKVLVLGEVEKPGVYVLDLQQTISEAVAMSGGLTDDAKDSAVIHIHRVSGKQVMTPVDIGKITRQGDLPSDVVLAPGDIVYVPKKTIASISTFMAHISKILSPIVMAETAFVLWPQLVDALEGNATTSTTPVVLPQ